ncbi:hypothetical protein J6590_023415 [Homalodisca vitripennis]|nr:hypothetical protein J6590_023415 [Homalodisca vitripennis]
MDRCSKLRSCPSQRIFHSTRSEVLIRWTTDGWLRDKNARWNTLSRIKIVYKKLPDLCFYSSGTNELPGERPDLLCANVCPVSPLVVPPLLLHSPSFVRLADNGLDKIPPSQHPIRNDEIYYFS